MMDVKTNEAETLILDILRSRGLGDKEAQLICRDLIEADLEGKATHGVGKLLLLDELLRQRRGSPFVKNTHGAVEIVDANRELGQLAGAFCVQRGIDLARKHGVGVVSVTNMARWARLSFIGEMIANDGFVGVVTNDAGPPAVVPFGGGSPILGTNPICFAFPGNPPVVIDFSTSMQPWGAIRQAILGGTKLPRGAFVDGDGNDCDDPERVEGVKSFGGAKGYALCVAIELLCGGLLAGVVGTDVASEYDLGALILVLDPEAFAGSSIVHSSVANLRAQMSKSKGSPRLPGDGARARRAAARNRGSFGIPEQTWLDLQAMASGKQARLQVNNKTN